MADKIQKIRNEVERRIEKYRNLVKTCRKEEYEYFKGELAASETMLLFIDSLQEEPVSEDLGEYLYELSKQFPEVSFAKLSRIAVRVAKWQKEQMMSKAIDFIIVDNNAISTEISTFPYVSLGTEGDTVKLIIINQD